MVRSPGRRKPLFVLIKHHGNLVKYHGNNFRGEKVLANVLRGDFFVLDFFFQCAIDRNRHPMELDLSIENSCGTYSSKWFQRFYQFKLG